jgi:hypothetical protein
LLLSFPTGARDGNLVDSHNAQDEFWEIRERIMAKPHRKLKKANHGKRPANSKARRLKRKDIRT